MVDDGFGDLPPVPQGRPSDGPKFGVIQGGRDAVEKLEAWRKAIKDFQEIKWGARTHTEVKALIRQGLAAKAPSDELNNFKDWCASKQICGKLDFKSYVDEEQAGLTLPQARPGAPIITWANHNLKDAVEEAEKYFMDLQVPMFDYGGKLVRMEFMPDGSVDLNLFNVDMMYEWMHRHIVWQSFDPDKGCAVAKKPQRDIASMLLARSDVWPYRKLNGISYVPLFRMDTGDVTVGSGYDPVTGIYVATDIEMVKISSAQEALCILRHMLRETVYDDPKGENEASTIAGIMTVVLRASFDLTPGWVVAAHEAASGKSTLQLVAGILATGRVPGVLAHGTKEDEFEKRLVAMLISGLNTVLVDNFNGVIRGELLAQMTTQNVLNLRVLGKSDIITVLNTYSVMINGNGIEIEGEQRRRNMVSYLKSDVENPERRTYSFDIFNYAKKNRDGLVSCIFKIVREYWRYKDEGSNGEYWRSEGTINANELAGFTNWNKLIRGSLTWLGLTDPLATGKRVAEEDTSEQNKVVMLTQLAAWSWQKFREQRSLGLNKIQPGEFLVKDLMEDIGTGGSTGSTGTATAELKNIVRAVAEIGGIVSDRRLGRFLANNLVGIIRQIDYGFEQYKVELERRFANGYAVYLVRWVKA